MADREIYEQLWNDALRRGIEDAGDLELAMLFLEKGQLLEKRYSILEIGCGIGKLCSRLYDMGYKNVTGIDIASSAISFGRNRFPNLNLLCMDAGSLAFRDNCFDVCLSFDLVEHIPDVNTHFEEVWRVLKPGGKYLFQTPNALSNSLITTIQTKGLGWTVYHPSLQFWWTLRRRLSDAGFIEVEFIKLAPLSNFKIQQVPRFLRWTFKHIPWEKLPLLLQTNYYVVSYKYRANQMPSAILRYSL